MYVIKNIQSVFYNYRLKGCLRHSVFNKLVTYIPNWWSRVHFIEVGGEISAFWNDLNDVCLCLRHILVDHHQCSQANEPSMTHAFGHCHSKTDHNSNRCTCTYQKDTGDLSLGIQGRTTVVSHCAHQKSEQGNQKQSFKTIYLSLHVQLVKKLRRVCRCIK